MNYGIFLYFFPEKTNQLSGYVPTFCPSPPSVILCRFEDSFRSETCQATSSNARPGRSHRCSGEFATGFLVAGGRLVRNGEATGRTWRTSQIHLVGLDSYWHMLSYGESRLIQWYILIPRKGANPPSWRFLTQPQQVCSCFSPPICRGQFLWHTNSLRSVQ